MSSKIALGLIHIIRLIKKNPSLKCDLGFRFPFLIIYVQWDRFDSDDREERESQFCRAIEVDISLFREISLNSLASFQFVTPLEFEQSNPANRGNHWLAALAGVPASKKKKSPNESGPYFVHFYGYKGGQARSTVLSQVAHHLSMSGHRVLAVDADIEAPSLDTIFGRPARLLEETVMGIGRRVDGRPATIQPSRVHFGFLKDGFVDLLSCRPQSSDYDLDYAAFTLRAAIDPILIDRVAEGIFQFACAKEYDVVLLDHRSGLAPSLFSWLHSFPGPVTLATRLDNQWVGAKHFLRAVFSVYPDNPGAIVCWRPDHELEEQFLRRSAAQIEELLELLAEAIASGGNEIELSAAEVEDHAVIWPYDSAFRYSQLPEFDQVSPLLTQRIDRLISVLGIPAPRPRRSQPLPKLSPSGADDEGFMIETDALRQLKTPQSSILYIFGRKGTGKTRLVRELAQAGMGTPLLSSSDSKEGMGIRAQSPELNAAIEKFSENPNRLWWALLFAGMNCPSSSTADLGRYFCDAIDKNISAMSIVEFLESNPGCKKVFLLDGLETAFGSKRIFEYLEALFHFMSTIENDSRICSHIKCKLFLRTDLAERGFQNVEQQVAGKLIKLSWNADKIFNFLLTRILNKKFFQQKFPDLIDRIEASKDRLIRGELPFDECEVLLKMAFPEKLNRNNLQTTTFLVTYFADTASDQRDRLTYYPRIFDTFLDVIESRSHDGREFSGPPIENSRLSQALIIFAHEIAAAEYLKQLIGELNFLLNLSDEPGENEARVRALIESFSGHGTPFVFDQLVKQSAKRTGMDVSRVSDAMNRMRSVGMFEDRPGFAGQWRVGRLFKSSLKMKYVRGSASNEL